MNVLTIVLVSLVALEHFYFLILEMFLWTTPKSINIFGLKSKTFAEDTKVFAANQGLYNGFLAAGLVLSLILNNHSFGCFFLICAIIAGIYGAYSSKKIKLFYIQSLPGFIALASLMFS